MIPSYPSVTFPNHYSIVTGLYPSHHGLVNNTFFDKKLNAKYSIGSDVVRDGEWYSGTPLWVLAEQQGMLADRKSVVSGKSVSVSVDLVVRGIIKQKKKEK